MNNDNQLRNTKLALVLGIGLAFLLLLGFFVLSYASVDSAATTGATSSSDSSFPWVIFAAMIPVIIVPIMVATRRNQNAGPSKPKKEKRKPQYIHDASGEMLEIVEEDDEDGVSDSLN